VCVEEEQDDVDMSMITINATAIALSNALIASFW